MTQTFAPEKSVLGRISSLIEEIDGEKRASAPARTKKASEMETSGSGSKDPGGYRRFGGGPTTHPSGKADAGTQSAPMGARAKENEEDVKNDIPASVDDTSPNSGGDQDSRQYNIGTNQSATGEDPKVEDNYKGDKEDPGTSSPANADDIGEKYSSMDFESLCKLAFDKMESVLADLACSLEFNGQQYKTAGTWQTQQPDDVQLAAQAGYELSGYDPELEKMAFIQAMTEQHIIDACKDADLVGEYLHKYADALQQQESDQTNHGIDPAVLAAAADGGSGGPGGITPEEAMLAAGGGMPTEAVTAAHGDVPAGAGGDGSGDDASDAINELANALLELGVSPEELIAALQQDGKDGEGSGLKDKAASARVKIPQEDAFALTKMAQAVKLHQLSGKMRIKEAKPGSKARQDRDEVKAYIREVCGIR